MRILAIRGENLASLTGFALELEHDPLAGAGLFAICGPTGAGKSTLLDALCVALFDKTPRLSVRGGVLIGHAGQDDNERLAANDVRGILRRGAASGFAEVDFLGRDDRRYRARWQVWRANRKPQGRIQPQQLSLMDLDSGANLSGTKTETLHTIEDRIGLDFEQFRRSALLAQGEFAAFLCADSGVRGELLERMTGTGIYSDLSKAAFERHKAEAEQLRALEGDVARHAVLGDEQRDDLERALAHACAELTAADADLATAERALAWYQRLRELTDAERAQRERLEAAQARHHAAADARHEQAAIERARARRDLLEAVDRHAREQSRAAEELAQANERDQEARARLQAAEREHASARESLERAQAEERALEPDLERALALDADIGLARQRLAERRAATEQAEQRAQATNADCQRLSAQLEALAGDAAGAESWLAENRWLEPLAQAWPRWDHELERFVALAGESRATAAASHAAPDAMIEAAPDTAIDPEPETGPRDQVRALNQQMRTLDVRIQEAERTLERMRMIVELAAHRARLRAGEPCPLCGACEHPHADRPAPGAQLLHDQRAYLEELRARRETLSEERIQAVRRGQDMRAIAEHFAPMLADVRARNALGLEHPGHADQPAVPDVVAALARDPEAVQRTCRDLVDEWTRQRELLGHTQVQRERLTARLNTVHALLHQQRADAASHRDAERACRDQLDALCAQRAGILGGRPVAEIRAEWTSRRERLEARLHALDERARQAAERAAVAAETVRTCREACDRGAREARHRQDALEQALANAGLTLEAMRAHCALGDAHVAARARELDDLERDLHRARAVMDERTQQRANHEQSGAPALSPEAARTAADAAKALRERASRQRTELEHQLRIDDQAREQRSRMARELLEQERRTHLYQTLSQLIGSADGKKFRVFAQSLTLDALLAYANYHLQDLAGRYRIVRVPGHDLDLQIIDRDMGDEVRSVNSLSGGESFLASLALALGLSSLAARDTTVESLLIDEGFGSLDPTALDAALSVLDALQATGRQVGLISHVPGLAERVGVCVNVQPRGNGRSVVKVSDH